MALKGVSKYDISRLAMRKAQTAKQIIGQGVYHICSRSDFTWRYLANLRPTLEYRKRRQPLTDVHAQLLGALKRDGIVITSIKEMMSDTSLFEELEAAILKYETSLADEISKNRLDVETPGRVKSYVIALRDTHPILDLRDIFVRFALQPEVLRIANGYFGMLTKLRYYNAWHNIPMQGPPRESQLWHRDPEDRNVLKIFVYLTDVYEGAGPLSYAPGTHVRGILKAVPESRLIREGSTNVRRSSDEQMSAVVPKKRWITAMGPKGTVVLADTKGYHKGGLVRDHDRILYTCMFTSQASTSPEQFERRLPIPTCSDRAVAFAIGG